METITKKLTVEKPEILIENWDQFEFSLMKLLFNRFGLNESHVGQRIKTILRDEKQLQNLTIWLVGTDWPSQISIVGNLKIIEI